MDLAVRVLETEEATGDDGDEIVLVVNADEIRDLRVHSESCAQLTYASTTPVAYLRVEKGSIVRVANAWGAIGDGLDVNRRGQVKGEEQRVELSQRASERVADLGKIYYR